MSPKTYSKRASSFIATVAALGMAPILQGQVEWTANSVVDFTWNNAANWNPGVPTLTDDVFFGFTVPNPGALPNPSQITLGAGSLANSLHFAGSYQLLGGTLQLGSGVIRADLGTTSLIGAELTGAAGLTKVGGGAVYLGNVANSYTGITTISNGSLIISSPAALGGDASAVIVNGAATRGFGGGSLVLDGLNGGMTFARDLVLQGYGPIADRSAALVALGSNEISGAISMAGGLVSTRMSAINGTLTLSGSLDVAGTAGTTISGLGSAANAAGVSNYLLTGAITGTGTLEKTGVGTLWLNPSDTSGFSGIVRVGQSATGTTSTVRITTPNVLGTRTTTGTGGVFDLNTGTLEIRMDAPSVLAGGLAANVYQRASSALFVDHSIGGSAVNGTAAFGQLAFEDNITMTLNSRNGYGASFTTAPVVGTTAGDNNSTITNNMGGLLSFTGNFWSNANNTGNRTMTIGGNGNTLINGNVVASAAAFNHNLTKSGSGQLTITGTGSTLDGSVNISGGILAITDFRSITNNNSAINIGSTTTAGILSIGTTTASTLAGLTTPKVINLAGTTGGATINASQTQVFPVTFNSNFTATGAGAKTLTLTGTNASDNTINGIIPNSTSNTAVLKTGPGTWVLAGANTYSGTTTLANGTLKLRANAAVSTVLPAANAVTFNASNNFAGATLEFVGQNGVNNVQTLGTLTYSAGANTVRVTPAAGGTASLTFSNIATTGAATVNFVGADFINNKITINQINAAAGSDGIITRSVFWNGTDYAYRQGGILRAPVYGVDPGTATTAVGPLTAGTNNEVTGSISIDTISVSTLKIAGSQALTLNAGQTLTLSAGGLLSTGGISSISGGTAVALGTQAFVARVNQATDVLTINSNITGTGGLTKAGEGTLVLSGTNSRTGTTSINEGTVRLSGGGTLSGANSTLNIRQGATLDLNGVSTGNSIGQFNNVGTVTNSSGDAATLQIGNNNGTGTSYGIVQDGSGKINVLKVGTGAQSWFGLSTYTGVTTIGSTGLVSVNTLSNIGQPSGIGAGDATSDATNAASLVFNGSTGGLVYVGNVTNNSLVLTAGSTSSTTNRLFTLAGTGATLSSTASNNNSIVWSNPGAIVHGVVGPQALTLTGTSAGDNWFFPQLTDSGTGPNVTSVVKTGTGTWLLGNSNNTYTGSTTIQGGTLVAFEGTSLPVASNVILDGGSLQTQGVLNRSVGTGAGAVQWTAHGSGGFSAANSKLSINLGSNPVWGVTPGFLGTGALLLSGASSLEEVEMVNGFEVTQGIATSFTATTTAASATVNLTSGTTAGLAVGQQINDNPNIPVGSTIASIVSATQFTLNSATGVLAGTGVVTNVAAGGYRQVNVADNANTATDFATISGVITGSGTLAKEGAGILRLTGLNTYTGQTAVRAGTLTVQSLGNSANPGLGTNVGSSTGANLDAGGITLGNGGTGGAILQYVGPGEVSDRMIRLNSTTGTNQIHADGTGPLILSNVNNTLSLGNKVLALRGSNTQGNMITSQLSDNGGTLGITVDGGATWILTNPLNNYTGVTAVNAGALGIGDDAALGSGAGNLALNNGSVFAFGGDRAVPNPLSLANNTTVAFIGDHSLAFPNTFSLLASANNVGTTNNIASGETLTLGPVTANAMTAARTWTVNGAGDTIVTGDITTSTAFNLNLTYSGTGSLTLAGTASNLNAGTLTVANGTLKLGANEVIPHGFTGPSSVTAAPVAASTTITVADTTGLVVGQPFTGLGVTAGATIASITDGTTFVASAAQTLTAGTQLYFNSKGNVVLSPAIGITATLDVNGRTETINGLTANTAGTAVINNSSASPASLSFGANDQAVAFTGEIRNTGAGALSISKTGAASAIFAQGPFEHQGTTSAIQGSLTLGGDVTATSGLIVGNGATLSITGALNGASVTSVSVGDGATLSLLNGAGSQMSGLTSLSLGSLGGTLTTLNLNVGDLNVAGDGLTTDSLNLLTGGTLGLFAGNQVLFNLADAGLSGNSTYTLLQVADGGLSALGLGNFLQGATPGGFDGFTWVVTDNFVRLQTGNLLTGNLYWTGDNNTNTTWNASANNWSTDKAGTIAATSIPGAGNDVFFAANSVPGTALTTTLEQSFRVNSLTFEPSATTPLSVTVAPGANPAAILDVKPATSDKGIAMASGGPAAVAINSGVKLGADQTWNIADAVALANPAYATASTTVTVGSTAGLVPGMLVGGVGIPAGTTIASITDGTTFVLSAPTTAASTGVSLSATSVLTVGGALSGSGIVTKTGSGRAVLTIPADATFTAPSVNVNGGQLQINSTTALGSTVLGNAATININNGGTFFYNGAAATTSNPINLNGGTLSAGGGTQTYNGGLTVSADSFVQMLDPVIGSAGRSITVSGVISGPGRLTIDSITTLSSGNQITGNFTVNQNNSGWTGGMNILRGSAVTTNVNGFGTGDILISLGKAAWQGPSGATWAVPNNITISDPLNNAIAEINVDATGTVTSPFTANFNGVITLGNAATTGEMRVFLADAANSVANFNGGVVLANNGIINVRDSAAAPTNINSVISETGGPRNLAINTLASSAWGGTGALVTLNAANTFTGSLTVGAGIVQFSTVSNIGGAASNLGMGTDILMSGGTLRFIGGSDQETDRPISTTATVTLQASGTAASKITFNGGITQTTNNALNLGGTGIGIIRGGLNQATGTTADINVQGGNWTFENTPLIVADDVIMNGASTLTLATSAIIANNGAGSTDNRLYVRGNSVLNLTADNVLAANMRGLTLGDATNIGTGTMNMNGHSLSIRRLDIGGIAAGFSGLIPGTGTINLPSVLTDYNDGIRLFRGSVEVNLAGTTTLLKQGLGDVTLSGDNSGLTGGLAASRIDSGNLILDFSANNASKISQGANLRMLGGNLILQGGILGPTTQNVLDLQLDGSGSNRITLISGAHATNLAFGGITRGASQGTIRFELPDSGAVTGIVANAAGLGILGGYATVKDAAGTWFATMNGTNLEGLVSTAKPDVSTWLSTDHVTDGASTFTGTSSGGSILSLRMNGAAGSNLALGHTSLAIASGGILATSNVATGSLGISGGFLSSSNNELVITQDSPLPMSVSSWVGSANGITKTGTGTLLLSGFNTYTGQTQLQAGTLEVTGGNALGDTSLLTMADDQFTTLRLLESETIGRLQGGSATDGLRDIAVVDVGVNRLTLNTSGGNVTYAGQLVGSGQIVKQGTNNQAFSNISLGFNGAIIVNEGLFQMNSVGQIDASSITINKSGNLLLDNNGTTRSGTRILDSTPVFLNSADGTFSGETTVRGLAIRTDQNATTSETIGNLVFSSGASYLTGQASGGTSAQASVIASNFIRDNNATVSVRGRNLGGTANERNQFRIGDATNQTNFLASSNLVGGTGGLGSTTQKIVPWAIGETLTGAVATTNMGNSLVTYVTGRGFIALDFTTEYAPYGTAAATDNVRESFTTDLTGLTGKTVNAIVLHNNTFASTNLNVTGAGAGQSLTSTSGAFLFTIASSTGSTVATNVGGFDSGIAVGGSEYVMHVVNPSAAAGSAVNVVTLNSPLTTAADLTKSGRGTLILTSVNTAGGGVNKTTINEGILEISDLDNLGGDTGALVLAGGTLRLSGTYSGDDLSLRAINLLAAGGTLDTNGNSLVLAGSLGSGVGGLNKTGLGSLTLNAAASYTGATTLSQGSIVLGADNGIGSGPLNLAGGTSLDLGAFNVSTGLVTLSGASPAILGTGAIHSSAGFFFNHTGDATVTAQLNGAGGLLKTQNNILTLNAANGYTGRTEVRAGTLVFDSITPIGGGASALGNPSTVLDGIITMGLTTTATTLTYTGAGHNSDRMIGLQGTTGGLTINADGTGGIGFGGATGIVPGVKSITLSGTADPALINILGGIVEGAATLSLVKSGSATWVLDGEGTYSGTTTVNEGILRIADDKALGSNAAGTVINSGATLQFTGDISVVGESLSLNGAGALGQDGVLVNVSGSNSFSGDITISTPATFVSQSGSMTLGAVSSFGDGLIVTGSGDTSIEGNLQLGTGQLTKLGTGVLSLGGDNTILGGVLLSEGILEVANAGALGASGNVTFDGGVFRHGVGDTVDHSGRFVANLGATYRIATSGQTVTYTSPLSGVGSGLEKSGAGTLVLGAVNTFDGPVTVTGGRLAISDEAQLGLAPGAFAAAQLLLDGGALNNTADLTLDDVNRGITLGAGGGIFDTDANTTLNLALAVEGPGVLIKDGSGTMVLNSVTTHTGGTQVQAGILRVGVSNAVSGDLSVTGSGTLDVDDKAVTVSSFSVSGAGAGVVGTGSINSAAGFSLTPTGDVTLSANLTGAGALTKSGAGTAFLSAANTYTGGSSIGEGALFLDGGSLATGPVTVASAASFGGIGTVNGPVTLLNGTGTNPGEQALLNVGGGVQSGLNLLTLEDSLTLGDFAIIDFYLSKTGFTKLDLNGATTFAANSRIRINLELGYIPSEGSVFDLLDWTTLNLLGGGTLLDYLLTPLPDLGGALWAWDTSTFAIDGMLKTTGLTTGPSVVTDPVGGRVLAGEPVTFTIDVAGSDPMTVQWYKGAGTANPIPGANTLSYTIPAVVGADSGSYWARIVNGVNTVDTQLAVLDVVTTPRIDVEPNGAVLFPAPGTDHTFSVTAVGPGTLSYVWNKGGVPISGAPDAPNYTISDVTIPDSGNYTVTVSNGFGSVTSAVAVLLVQESIVFDTQPLTPSPAVPEGNTASFSVSVSGDGPFTYQWEFDAVGGAATFVPLSGEILPTLSRNVELATLGNYRVVVSNAYASRTSDPATLAFGNPQVVIDTQPISKLVALGSTLELTVASSGGKPQKYQWYFKGKPVGDETDATLRIEDVTSARAGQYFCRISNALVSGSTQVDSAIVTVAVVDQKPGRFVVTPPGSVNLSVTAFSDRSDPLTYQWFMDDGLVSAPNVQPIAGATARTLKVTNVTAGRKRFFCRVSAGSGSRFLDGGDNVVFVYTQAPALQPEGSWSLPDTIVSQPYSFQVPMVDNPLEPGQPDPLKMPVSFKAVGLPKGLTINSAGLISGRATVERRDSAGTVIPYVVTITATNKQGTTTPIIKNLLVNPLDMGLIGAFTGPVDRNASLNGNLGGIINFTTTKTGTYSGKLTMGSKTYSFKGALNSAVSDPTNPSVTVKVSRGSALRPLLVSFRLNSAGFVTGPTLLLTRGTITDGRTICEFDGWRNTWLKTKVNPTPALAYSGYYTLGLELPLLLQGNMTIPQGTGYASFTVNSATGKLSVAGRLADGTAFTTATYVGPTGEIAVFRTIYSSKALGSVLGSLTIDDLVPNDINDNTLAGTLSWWKPAQAGRAYAAGFGPFDLVAVGSRYNPPAAGTPVMSITPPAVVGQVNAVVELLGANIETATPQATVPAANQTGFSVTTANKAVADVLNNPRKMTATINAKTGAVTGSVTLSAGHPFGGSPAVITRKFSYFALIVNNGVVQQAWGYYLLPQLPANAVEKVTATPILSGQAVFEKFP